MTGYQNVAQPVRSFFRQLTALVALYGVLGMISPLAVARVEPPFKCIYCCPTGGCNGAQYYAAMMTYHATSMNTSYSGYLPSVALMHAEATAVENFVSYQDQEGNWPALQAFVIGLIDNGTFKNAMLNAAQGYAAAKAYGSVVPAAVLQAMMNKVSPTDREAAAATIAKSGLRAYLLNVAANLNAAGHAFNRYRPFDPFHLRPNNPTVQTFADGCLLGGAIIMAVTTAPAWVAIATGLLIGGAALTFINDLGGYGE